MISDSDPSSPQVVNLTGQGSELSLSLSKVSFTGTPVGSTSAPKVITLKNLGTGTINISQVQATGPYSQTNTCTGPLVGGASCTVSTSFSPLVSGSNYGAIYVTNDGPGSPEAVALSGTSSALLFTPTQLTFPAQAVGTTSQPLTFTIKNVTSTAVNFGKGAISGPFKETNTCGSSILGNSSCTFTVTFTPTATGTQSGSIRNTAADFLSPFTTKLTGTGQ